MNLGSLKAMNPNADYGKAKPQRKVKAVYVKTISAEQKAKVIAVLTEKGELSRSHLSGYTGYERSTVSKIATILVEEGVLSRRQNGREAMFSLVSNQSIN